MDTINSFLANLLEVAMIVIAHDFLRYAIGAGGVFVIVNGLLSRALAGRRIRERTLGEGQIKRELLTSLRTIFVFSIVGVTIGLGTEYGWLKFYADPGALGWIWFAISAVLLIVLHDAWFYWTHRIIHHPRLFRRCHRTHHKSYNPTPLTAYAFDTEEAIVNAVYVLLAGLVMPISFLAMFIFTTHMMLRNAIGHCGYELFPRTAKGRPLFDWITTVTHHDLHHAQAGWNYGLYFTFWDRLMGTEHPQYYQRFAAAIRKDLKPETKHMPEAIAILLVGVLALTGVVAAISPLANAEAQQPTVPIEHISGNWATQGYGAIVEIGACEQTPEELCGTLVWAWHPSDMKPGSIGGLMLSKARFETGKWRGGKLRNPEDGRTYRGTILQTSPDTLELHGCALVFCQTQVWHRLESLPHIAGLTAMPAQGGTK